MTGREVSASEEMAKRLLKDVMGIDGPDHVERRIAVVATYLETYAASEQAKLPPVAQRLLENRLEWQADVICRIEYLERDFKSMDDAFCTRFGRLENQMLMSATAPGGTPHDQVRRYWEGTDGGASYTVIANDPVMAMLLIAQHLMDSGNTEADEINVSEMAEERVKASVVRGDNGGPLVDMPYGMVACSEY